MLSKLIAALQHANLDMTAEEIADTLWLALQMDAQSGEMGIPPASSSQSSNVNEDSSSDQTDPSLLPAPPVKETTADVHLHAQNRHGGNTSYVTSRPFRSPAAPALPNALALARALRPLMRRLRSKTAVVFNEHATAQSIAETQAHLWLPVFEPAPIRWFDVELVVDIGASMSLWQETVAELQALLEHIGAFRNVRIWRLATDNTDRVDIYAGTAQQQAVARNPREIIRPGGHRLILVATDCISPAWHSGKVQELLDIWGQKNLVTLIQMLPRRLWPQTTLENADFVQIYSSQSEASNRGLKIKKALRWSDEGSPMKQLLPLPTLTLEAGVLSPWAQILTGTKKTWVTGTIFEHALTDMIQEEGISSGLTEEEALSPKKRAQLFRASASSLARKLAGLLAAAPIPISLPVIRQVQRTMLPEANQVHVAEVFLGSLLEEIYRDATHQNPDQVQYDFIAGVRGELINTVPIPDAHRVLREISQFVRDRYGQPRDFLAFIALPYRESTSDTSITQGSHPFAHLELRALRRFGGTFVEFVDELERYLQLMSEQRNEPQEDDNHQTVLETPKEYSTNRAYPVSPTPSFMDKTWCDFSWGPWLPLNSPEIPTDPGIYRVKATRGNELLFIGSTGRSLRGRIGDLYRNIMRDAAQMPFNDPHTAAPALWAWRDAAGIDFECSAITSSTQENLQILVHYFLWQYRLEKGNSTLTNHGRFPAQYAKSKDRKTGVRGYRLPEGQFNPAGGPSFPPLSLIATPVEKNWMGLTWSESYPLHSTMLQNIVSSPGSYKLLDGDNGQMLFVGTSTNLRNRFQSQVRKNWNCPNPVFSFAALPSDILPHQLAEIENDLLAGYFSQEHTAPAFQFKGFQSVEEEIPIDEENSNIQSFSRKRALLVLAGGRPLPDILALHYWQPALTTIIFPSEGSLYDQSFADIAKFFGEVRVIKNPDSSNIEASKHICNNACQPYPDDEWEWIVTTSSAPKVMTVVGYEFAREKDIPCINIDITNEEVISLAREIEVDKQKLFHTTVNQYVKSYGYHGENILLAEERYREQAIAWSGAAKDLALSPDSDTLLYAIRNKEAQIPITLPSSLIASPLLSTLKKHELLDATLNSNDGTLTCSLLSQNSTRFLSIDWLEVYIWHEVMRAGFADDCQWNYQFTDGKRRVALDLAITYKSRLLIIECKTSRDIFNDKAPFIPINTCAQLLGGNYVTKYLVTNQSFNSQVYEHFNKQAKQSKLIIIAKEDLPDIAAILKREAANPTFMMT